MALVVVSSASPASAYVQRVPTNFFGVNGQGIFPLAKPQTADPAALAAHLDGIKSTSVGWVRAGASWALVEPEAPVFGSHTYNWTAFDTWVTALAERGMRWHPTLHNAPSWAQSSTLLAVCTGRQRQMLPPKSPTAFGTFAAAVAKRYGPSGTFWDSHSGLPYRPVVEYEVFNEVNDKAYYCPKPDPAGYAHLYMAARNSIHAVDPAARVMIGGLAANRYLVAPPDPHADDWRVEDFLRGMVNAEPGLTVKLDAVGVHSYRRDPADVLADFAWFRRTLERVGLGSAPLSVVETGWPTQGPFPADDVSEAQRAISYHELTNAAARTDCNVMGFAPFTWITNEVDPTTAEDWYGIASQSGVPYPSAQAYGAEVKLFLGKGTQPAPRTTKRVCGLALPDTDKDGTPDERDDYPLDATRNSGSGEHNPADDPAPQERFQPSRVPDEFFGISGIESIRGLLSEDQHTHYEAMHDAGIGSVRGIVRWDELEPLPPSSAYHEYQWGELDKAFRRAATHGLRWRPTFRNAPAWALAAAPTTQARAQFATFLTAFAGRYGRGGSFWDENRGVPRLPVTDYEPWYRGNVSVQWVDGTASATEYADFFLAARAALLAVDPQADAVVSLSSGGVQADDAFLRAMVTARPELAGSIDGVHLVTAQTNQPGIEAELAILRSAVDGTGNAGSPISLEASFAQGGPGAMTDAQRQTAYRTLADRLARSDCGMDGLFPRAWTSAETISASPEDWVGIARPATGVLYLAGQGYREKALLYEGRTGERAPYGTVHVCGAAAPDHDGDGVPDEADDFPLDAGRVSGSDGDGDGIFDPLDADFTPGADITPPTVSIDSGPDDPTADTTPTLTFSSEPGATFECRFDTEPAFRGCAGGADTAASPLPDGPHTFWIRARDAAGNVSAPASRTFNIDTGGPVAAIESGPLAAVPVNDPTPTFTFSSPEPGGFLCRIDGGLFLPCLSPFTTGALADGSHTLTVKALDLLGNAGPVATRNFVLDLIAPVPAWDSAPSGTIGIDHATFAFSAAGRPVRFDCSLDGAAWVACTSPQELAGLADGSHTFRMRAADAAGNVSAPLARTFSVATGTALDTRIDSGPSGPTADASPDFAFSATVIPATFECSVDGGAFAGCSSPKHLSALADGSHTFAVRAKDGAGHLDPTPATRTFSVDASGPVVGFDSGPGPGAEAPTTDTTPTFAFSSEPGASFECRMDGSAFSACTSPYTAAALAEGLHTIGIRATDALGNTGTIAARTFTVDLTAPVVHIDSGPTGTITVDAATFAFSAAGNPTGYECSLDGGTYGACTSPRELSGLVDGSHTFRVRALDAAGNVSAPVSRTFTVDTGVADTTPPVVQVESGPTGPTADARPRFTFSSEPGATFDCRFDGAAWGACSEANAHQPASALVEGSHTFWVRARDTAGNLSTAASRTFTVDLTAPIAHIDSGPTGTITTSATNFAFSATGNPAGYECSLDTGAYESCTSPRGLTGLVDGSHTFRVRALDAAGNISAAVSRAFTVDTTVADTTPPVVQVDSGPNGPVADARPRFTFSSEPEATFNCRFDGAAWGACSEANAHQPASALAAGSHTFWVRARDAAGNLSTAASRTFTVDLTAPIAHIDSGPTGTITTSSATFAFSATGKPAGFLCSLDGGAYSACTSPQELTGLADGSHTFRVRALDAAGNLSAVVSRSFAVSATAPATKTLDTRIVKPDRRRTSDRTPRIVFRAGDEAIRFTCRIDDRSWRRCSSPYVPRLRLGHHLVRVAAIDAAGNREDGPARLRLVILSD